jgi:hypothetical protein
VYTFAGQSIQIDGQGCHERLTFTGLHLSDFALSDEQKMIQQTVRSFSREPGITE